MARQSAIDDLFLRSLEVASDLRADFVTAAAKGDGDLRDAVLGLLVAAEGASPLDEPLGMAAGGLLETLEAAGLARDSLEGAQLGHYRVGKLRGEGGMALVYEGERVDGTFERRVAIKVLRSELRTESERQRFHRERNILAGLSNPHIASLYDGGLTEDGRPYFVLEWIEGRNLVEHCSEQNLSIEEKLKLVLQVCEGLRHAHRRGVMHRDVKPSNLLVERRSSGADRAIVVDFGIAKSLTGSGETALTLTGQALGTPGYMSPEQAMGAAELAPAADVFSLGAVLFELVCGVPVYRGGTPSEILAQALAGDIAAPRRLVPGLPRDLETLLLVALDPRPDRRYSSIAALASDIESYLAGEPLAGRRPGLVDRVSRQAKRRPWTSALLLAGSLSLLLLVFVVLQTRWSAAKRAEAARRFGEQIERVDSILRIAHGLPLHELRPDYARVESLLAGIRAEVEKDPDLLSAGGYALGRGELGLGRLDEARKDLESARSAGNDTPELQLTLGRVLAEIYDRDLTVAQKLRDTEERDRELERLEKEFRDPAIALLRAGQSSAAEAGVGSETYVQARLALQNGDHASSRQLARQAAEALPWFYESWIVEARATMAAGDAAKDRGEYDEAAHDYGEAREAFNRALEVGRSDPQLHFRNCTLANRILALRREVGSLDEALFARTVEDCQQGLVADPDHYNLSWSLARVHWQEQNYLRKMGEDPLPAVDRQIAMSERAVSLRPDLPQARNLLGLGWMARAQEAIAQGLSAEKHLARAQQAFEGTLDVDPTHRHANNNLGLIHYYQTLALLDQGLDPRPTAERAIAAYERTIELDSEYLFAYNNAVVVWRILARDTVANGGDPESEWRAGDASAAHALELNPNFSNALENRADLLLDRLDYLEDHGVTDPEPFLSQGLDLARRAVEINPQFWSHHCALGQMERRASWWGTDRRASTESLKRSQEAIAEALRLNPDEVEAQREWVALRLDQAELFRGIDRQRLMEDASRVLGRLLEQHGEDPRVQDLATRLASAD